MALYFRSVAGALGNPIRDNEIRVEFLGISVDRLIHLKLVISGMLAGIGGALAALAVQHVDPAMSYWTTSGGFVFVTILAGAGSVAAAFVGSLVFELVRSIAVDLVPGEWQMILGTVLLLTILFLPEGLGSLVVAFPARRRGRGVMSDILAVRDLEKTFGSVVAARDISVSVPVGQTVGIIGANGAGKTTFVNMITGHLAPSKGSIQFEGKDITGLPSREITRLGISRSFQVAQVFPTHDRVREHARRLGDRAGPRQHHRAGVHARSMRAETPAEADAAIELFQIAPYRDATRRDLAARRPQAARHRDGGRRFAAPLAARRADQRHLHRGEIRPDGTW